MSSDVTLQIYRVGKATGLPFSTQLDFMSQQEAATYGGAAPYTRYMGYVDQILTVLADDKLIDTQNIDPKTETNVVYSAVIDGETFDYDGHTELILDKPRGT